MNLLPNVGARPNYHLARGPGRNALAMSAAFDNGTSPLQAEPKTWLVTGVAGFVGSNLLEGLLNLNQTGVGDEVQSLVGTDQWARFRFPVPLHPAPLTGPMPFARFAFVQFEKS